MFLHSYRRPFAKLSSLFPRRRDSTFTRCVLDAGRHIERIIREDGRIRADSDIEGLRKRLAIDQLRVALSRPTERLLWLDINPTDQMVRRSIAFLNGGDVESGVSSCVPAALVKTLEEDELDAEERVQRCQVWMPGSTCK